MAFNFFKKKQNCHIGLDIVPDGITAVLLDKQNKNFSVKNIAYKSFPKEIIQNGMIINSEIFINTLNEMLNENKFDSKTVNMAVSGNIPFIKTITLPDLPIEELGLIISQEAAKHIPFPLEEANIDFQVLENTRRQENSSKKVDVVLVALAKSMVKNYTDHINQANLELAAVDISPFAVIRTFAHAGIIDDSDCIYLSILIGYENTDINIIYKGMPLFSNNIPVGRKNIIESISHGLEIDYKFAEELLPQVALVVPGMNIEETDPKLSKAGSIVKTIYNNISNEIQKTIEFHYSQNIEAKEIKKIIISGSGVCVQNIDKYIEHRLKIETVLYNSLNNIEHDTEITDIPSLAVSIGLALKGSEY